MELAVIYNIPRDFHGKRRWVESRLARRGLNLSSLARQHGVANAGFYQSFGGGVYPRYQRLIAEACGVDPSSLWPEVFLEDKDAIAYHGSDPLNRDWGGAPPRPEWAAR